MDVQFCARLAPRVKWKENHESLSNDFFAGSAYAPTDADWASLQSPRHDHRPRVRGGHERVCLLLFRQDRVVVERRQASEPRTTAAPVRRDGTPRGQSQFAV